jgi:hypothetical protein
MKYYKLFAGGSPNKQGYSVQWVMPQDYHLDAPYSFRNANLAMPILADFRLPIFKLAHGAMLLDTFCIPEFSSHFEVASTELVQLIKQHKTLPFTATQLQIEQRKGTNSDYYAIHFDTHKTSEFIDWKSAAFCIKEGHDKTIQSDIQFTDYDAWSEEMKRVVLANYRQTLKLQHLGINPDFDLDFFWLRSPLTGLYCSERFLDAIHVNGITGFHAMDIAY